MLSSTTVLPYQVHKNKRLAFAENIRRRFRTQKMVQIRSDTQIRQKILSILSILEESSSQTVQNNIKKPSELALTQIYNEMHVSKVFQYNAAHAIGSWLTKQDRNLCIKVGHELMYWGYFLTSVIQYDNNYVEVLLEKYLDQLVSKCKEIKSFQIVFLFMHKIMLNATNFNKFRKQELTKYFLKVIQIKNSKQFIYQQNFRVFELRCYQTSIKISNKIIIYLANDEQILAKMVTYFQNHSQNILQISLILSILVAITYFQNYQYFGVTEKLIEYDLLSCIKFHLQFNKRPQMQQIIIFGCKLLSNIIVNVGSIVIWETMIISQIWDIIQNYNQSKQVIISACELFTTAIQQSDGNQFQLRKIRQFQYVSKLLYIADKLVDVSNNILYACVEALNKILKLGEMLKQINKQDINSYCLLLKYSDAEFILSKRAEFREIVDVLTGTKQGSETENKDENYNSIGNK